MAEESVEETQLNDGNAAQVIKKLMPLRNHSYHLGLNLNLPRDVVEEIPSTHKETSERLRQVVTEALKRGSCSTWRDIIHALRSPPVCLTSVANVLEADLFPNPEPLKAPSGEL